MLWTNQSIGYLTVHHYFPGIGSIVVVSVFSTPSLGLVSIGKTIRWVFYILIPNFCVGIGIQDLYTNYNNKKICTGSHIQGSLEAYCQYARYANVTVAPCCPGERFTKNLGHPKSGYPNYQLVIAHIQVTRSQQNAAHVTTALLPWHVQHFVLVKPTK